MQTVKAKAAKAKPVTAAALNRISSTLNINEQKSAKKDEIPVVFVEGDLCRRFNEAKKQAKDAESIAKELETIIKQRAMEEIFARNCAPGCVHQVTTVKLQDVSIAAHDETERYPGEVTRVSFTSRYNSCDTDEVVSAFQHGFTGRDINNYMVETLSAKFDSSVFLDTDGCFNPVAFNKFRAAVERAAKELGMVDPDGKVISPLSTNKVLLPKPDFHERRFKDFSAEENFDLVEIVPNTVQCVPVRTA